MKNWYDKLITKTYVPKSPVKKNASASGRKGESKEDYVKRNKAKYEAIQKKKKK